MPQVWVFWLFFFFSFFEHAIVCAELLGCMAQVIKRKAEGRK